MVKQGRKNFDAMWPDSHMGISHGYRAIKEGAPERCRGRAHRGSDIWAVRADGKRPVFVGACLESNSSPVSY